MNIFLLTMEAGDDTVERISEIAGNKPNVKIILDEKNRGMGNAIKTGLISCQGALVITMDADLTFLPG